MEFPIKKSGKGYVKFNRTALSYSGRCHEIRMKKSARRCNLIVTVIRTVRSRRRRA